jgi:hypothetical protein
MKTKPKKSAPAPAPKPPLDWERLFHGVVLLAVLIWQIITHSTVRDNTEKVDALQTVTAVHANQVDDLKRDVKAHEIELNKTDKLIQGLTKILQ